MAILLADISFDPARTAVRERIEEVGGRDARRIEITGLVDGPSVADVEARLDAVVAAASVAPSTPLSLRPGRRLWVRRVAFRREVRPDKKVGSFELTLEAPDPFEESESEREAAWPLAASGDSLVLETAGNAVARPVIVFTPETARLNPSFTDGVRTLTYPGAVQPGQVLTFDGPAGKALLDGTDVTSFTQGLFPRIVPGASTLHYFDDGAGSPVGTAAVRFRDRWS